MAIYALFDPTAYLTEHSGWGLFADLLFGGNGEMPWRSELYVGTGSENDAYGGVVWDPDFTDGFDSESVGVSYDANLSTGTATLGTSNETSSPVTYAGTSGGTIGSVEIIAKVQTVGTVEWSDLSMAFWHGDVMGESISINDGPTADVDTLGEVEEQRLVVTPANTTYDRVTVSGTFQMWCGADVQPDWADLWGQILITPA